MSATPKPTKLHEDAKRLVVEALSEFGQKASPALVNSVATKVEQTIPRKGGRVKEEN